jgi:hypothetical protein
VPPNFIVDAEACKCKRGYVLAGAACVACAGGTYSTALDARECAACVETTFSAPGSTACTPSHADSHVPVGSSSQDACVCNAGFFFNETENGLLAYNTFE